MTTFPVELFAGPPRVRRGTHGRRKHSSYKVFGVPVHKFFVRSPAALRTDHRQHDEAATVLTTRTSGSPSGCASSVPARHLISAARRREASQALYFGLVATRQMTPAPSRPDAISQGHADPRSAVIRAFRGAYRHLAAEPRRCARSRRSRFPVEDAVWFHADLFLCNH